MHRLAHFRDLFASSNYLRGKYVFESIVKKGTENYKFLEMLRKCTMNYLVGDLVVSDNFLVFFKIFDLATLLRRRSKKKSLK